MLFAFISRHKPTPEQHTLAAEKEIELRHIGDHDAFTVDFGFVDRAGVFDGVIVVHPAAAMRLANEFVIGVFENASKPGPNDRPVFEAKALHVYDLVH